ncbi:MAG: family 78 glycoside hydrolase catalytic domain [Pseudobutyrivibrio sp.]|nr:family 78 glycoside hydrolase catalytic domain [Pseudobutyrivibrio sp.]
MGNLKVQRITVEHMVNPIGIDIVSPRFGWILENLADKDVKQVAYQLNLYADSEMVFDSGRIESDSSIEVELDNVLLEPKTEYKVVLHVWDNKGNEAEKETYFETGYLGTKFEADWYEPEQIPTEKTWDENNFSPFSLDIEVDPNRDFSEFRPCQYVRIPVEIKKNIRKARTYISVHGIYRIYVNGKRVDDREFAPGITSYQGLLQYQTYDITQFLNDGKNIVGVILADGWWIGRVGLTGDSCQFGQTLGLIVETEVTYQDGTKEIFTALNGKSSNGPLIFSDIFVGEKYDATKELDGWSEPPFDDSGWSPLKKVEYDKSNLVGQYGEVVRPISIFAPEKIIITPAGETVIDAGQVLAGQIEITLDTKAGHVIKLEHSEVLSKEGNYYNNVLGINKEQTDYYITKDGAQVYRPYFSYHGFRYVKVTGWPGELTVDNVKIYALSTDMENTGKFSTSNEKLNQLQHNIVWSAYSNTLSIPTDCPQRERAGWTGDIMAFAPTLCFNRGADSFLTRWLRSMRIDQRPDGAVPDIIPYLKAYELTNSNPDFGSHTSCGWGDAILIVPYAVYKAYGDKRILEENYDAMTKWMDYIKDRAENHHPEAYESWDEAHKARSKYLWNTDFHFGDWLVPSMVLGNPDGAAMINTALATKDYVAPAYYAFSAKNMSEISSVLGLKAESKYYSDLYEKIRQAYIEEYVDENGLLPQELQGLYVIALKMDLVPDALRPKMVNHLREMIEANDNKLDTGFLSVLFLMDVLCDNGLKDLAFKILYQNKCPSWLYEIEHGATTMWESWGAVLEDGSTSTYSYNHYAFGCVGEWLYKTIGGLKCDSPGYKHFTVDPDYSFNLDFAETEHNTPYGKIAVSWKLKDTHALLHVEIPVNTKASINLKSDEYKEVGSGVYDFEVAL